MKKEAGFDSLRKATSEAIRALPDQLLPAIALAGIMTAGERGISAIGGVVQKNRAFKAMLGMSPALRKKPAATVQAYFNSVWRFNPTLAQDPIGAVDAVTALMEGGEMGKHVMMLGMAGRGPSGGVMMSPLSRSLISSTLEASPAIAIAAGQRKAIATAAYKTKIKELGFEGDDVGLGLEEGPGFGAGGSSGKPSLKGFGKKGSAKAALISGTKGLFGG